MCEWRENSGSTAKPVECNGPRALSRTHKSSEQGRVEGTAKDKEMNSQPRLCGRLSSVRKKGGADPLQNSEEATRTCVRSVTS